MEEIAAARAADSLQLQLLGMFYDRVFRNRSDKKVRCMITAFLARNSKHHFFWFSVASVC